MSSNHTSTLSARHKSNIRNVTGTFAAEGMLISPATRRNLDCIASGKASYQQVLRELQAKYAKEGMGCFQHGPVHILPHGQRCSDGMFGNRGDVTDGKTDFR